jgi:voltage-gated potassium channel Kch
METYTGPFGHDTGIPVAPEVRFDSNQIIITWGGMQYALENSMVITMLISLITISLPFILIPCAIGIVTYIEERIAKLGPRGELIIRKLEFQRENLRVWLETSILGKCLDVVQVILTFLVFGYYVLEMYYPLVPVWLTVLDLFFFAFIAFDYGLRLYASAHRMRFFLSFMSFVDIAAFVPTFAYYLLNGLPHSDQVLQPLVLIRGIRILRLYRLRSLIANAVLKQAVSLVTTAVAVILILASVFHFMENTYGGQDLTFHDSVYFAIVSIATVGYGDITPTVPISRFFVSVMILVAIVAVPLQTQQLITMYYAQNPYLMSFSKGWSKRHVVVVGDFSYWQFLSFVREFFHFSYNTRGLKVVFLSSKEPNKRMRVLLEHPSLQYKLQFLEGSARKVEDLERASIRTAETVIILTDSLHRQAESLDSLAVMNYVSIKDFCPESDVRMQVVSKRGVRLALAAGFPSDKLTCQNEIAMGLLATGTQCRGFVCFLSNLACAPRHLGLNLKHSMPWGEEYIRGTTLKIFPIRFPSTFWGMSYLRAQYLLFKMHNAMLIGISVRVNTKRHVLLNAGGNVIIEDDTCGYAIARDEAVAMEILATRIPEDVSEYSSRYDFFVTPSEDIHDVEFDGELKSTDISLVDASQKDMAELKAADLENNRAVEKDEGNSLQDDTFGGDNEQMDANAALDEAIDVASHVYFHRSRPPSTVSVSTRTLTASYQNDLERKLSSYALVSMALPTDHAEQAAEGSTLLDVDEIGSAMARMRARTIYHRSLGLNAGQTEGLEVPRVYSFDLDTPRSMELNDIPGIQVEHVDEDVESNKSNSGRERRGSSLSIPGIAAATRAIRRMSVASEVTGLGEEKMPVMDQGPTMVTAQYLPVSSFLRYELDNMEGHHLVLGYHPTLVHFVSSQRAAYLGPTYPPIVVVVKALPTDEEWSPLSIFQDVFIVQRTVSFMSDAERINVKSCGSFTILANGSEGDSLSDCETVFVMQVLDNLLGPSKPRVAEIVDISSIRLLPQLITAKEYTDMEEEYQKVNSSSGFEYDPNLLRNHVTAGHVLSSSILDAVTCQSYFKADMMAIISALILNVNSSTVQELRSAGFWESHPIQKLVPEQWIGQDISAFCEHMFDCMCTPLYLYRKVMFEEKFLQYTIPLTAARGVIQESDEVCYLHCEISKPLK